MQRKFDRHAPPPLPNRRMLSRTTPVLPPVVDLRKWCGAVKDQGNEGACTAHAGTSAVEWINRKYLGKSPTFSPQYTYVKELLAQGSFPDDVGSDGVTLCGSLIASGCCELSLFPYVPGQIIAPTPAQDSNAVGWRMGAYHGLTGSQVALSVLGDPVPWPVEMGFTVMADFQSDEVAETGVYLARGDSLNEGHEILAVGYDVGAIPTLRPKDCPPAVLFQNSWGDWGFEHGFVWVVLSVLDASDTDLKITHSGAPWK